MLLIHLVKMQSIYAVHENLQLISNYGSLFSLISISLQADLFLFLCKVV